MKLGVALAPVGTLRGARPWPAIARGSATHMAHRFIAGSTPAEAFETVKRLRSTGRRLHRRPARRGRHQRRRGRGLSGHLHRPAPRSRPPAGVDARGPPARPSPYGPIPRVNLSLKLTSLTPRFDALHAESTTRRVARPTPADPPGRPREWGVRQRRHGAVRPQGPDLRHLPRGSGPSPSSATGPTSGSSARPICPRPRTTSAGWKAWVRRRGTPITIRLVKGAYWDYEVTHARQMGWPVPVYLKKWQSDASFERCARFLMEHHERLRPALGSHNIRSLAHAMAAAESLGVPTDAYEVQMLHGMGEPIERALVARGHRVRVYTPYGAMLPGMAYLVRRLLENTSNESFLKASFAGGAEVEGLLRDPEEVGAMLFTKRRKPATAGPPAPVRERAADRLHPARGRDRDDRGARRSPGRPRRTVPTGCRSSSTARRSVSGETLEVDVPGRHSVRFSVTSLRRRAEADRPSPSLASRSSRGRVRRLANGPRSSSAPRRS